MTRKKQLTPTWPILGDLHPKNNDFMAAISRVVPGAVVRAWPFDSLFTSHPTFSWVFVEGVPGETAPYILAWASSEAEWADMEDVGRRIGDPRSRAPEVDGFLWRLNQGSVKALSPKQAVELGKQQAAVQAAISALVGAG